MDITGTYTFDAPPARVWELLMDTEALASCIPGCERFEPDGKDRYRVTLAVGLAAITGTYEGVVSLTKQKPPHSYVLVVEGEGKAGFVKGDVTITLRPDGKTTIVDVSGEVESGGMIARLGQRLIGNVNKMMQDRFFSCLQSKI